MPDKKSCVVVTGLPPLDYRNDYVSLPENYGTDSYFAREDVRAITAAVTETLDGLDVRLGISKRISGKKVIVKPNLVTVYHDMGMMERDYPETTDPRVLDAVVSWLKSRADFIVIAESSGRGAPTRGSFTVAGLDQLAWYRRCKLVALEEEPYDRYIVPGARIQKEIAIPRLFSEVVRGEAFYISVPKLKTNLYTGVTLGFKNAMGILPYNLRQRNHNWAIDQKLVDMLLLFKPDLVVVDGVVGGEGNCPAPVDPVDSRMIIAGNNCVETDRVAAKMMGLNPSNIPLIRDAEEMGFGDPYTEVVGGGRVVPFKPADPSLMSDGFTALYPNAKALIGHEKRNAPRVDGTGGPNPDAALAMEGVCRGGCLATMRFAFEMLRCEGLKIEKPVTIVIGEGAIGGKGRVWLDRTGKAYGPDDIKALPGKKLAVGSCTKGLGGVVDAQIPGCMPFPNAPHMALHKMTGTKCQVMSLKNKNLLPMLAAVIRMHRNRAALIRRGERIDVTLHDDDSVIDPPIPPSASPNAAFIPWPFPPLTRDEIKAALKAERRALINTLLGR